jgi:O-antigen ligase
MNKQSVLYFLVMSFFTVGAVWQGFFSEWSLFLVASILFVIGAIVCFTSRQIRVTWLHICLLLYVAMYFISIFYAVDRENSIIETGRVLLLVPLLGLLMSLDKERIHAAQLGFTRIAAGVVLLGIAFNMERNDRLESTIEYANALAIVLLVTMIIALLQYVQHGKRRELVVSAILFSGLLLTMSRSVWVLWIGAAIVLLIIIPKFRRINTMVAIGIAHVAGFIIACAYKGDVLFFQGRVQSIQPETSEFKIRLVYWQDGLNMLKDYWWKGTGGGGWSLLQSEYQSKNYFVKYIHNHYIQTALDVGVLGLVFFLVIIGLFTFAICRQLIHGEAAEKNWSKGMLAAVFVMLLHAGFDFDLTFPLLSGVLLLLIVRSAGYWPVALTIRSNRIMKLFGIVCLVGCAVLAWLAVGYREKQTAILFRDHGQLAAAVPHFKSAARMIPWSSTIHYEYGKAYVLIGNETQNRQAYKNAQKEVEIASRLQPKETLYKDLLKDLENVGK